MTTPIFSIVPCEPSFPVFGGMKLELPEYNETQHLYFAVGDTAPFAWQQVATKEECRCRKGDTCHFALLRHTPFSWMFVLEQWLTDATSNHTYDFRMKGEMQITDASSFLEKAPATGTLTGEMLNSILQQAVGKTVEEALHSLRNDFSDRELLEGGKVEQSLDWFVNRMEPVFATFGCHLAGEVATSWYSKEKIAEEEAALEKLRVEKEQNRIAWEREVERERKESLARYEKEIQAIETDTTLQQMERERRIERAREKISIEQREHDHRQAAKRREEEWKEAEHIENIARMKAETEAIQRAAQRKEKIEEEWAVEQQRMKNLREAIDTRLGFVDAQIDRLVSQGDRLEEMSRQNQKVEWLHSWGVRPEDLHYLGFDAYRQSFFDDLEKKSTKDRIVRMYMNGLVRSRDAGCPIDQLPIGKDLNFKISSNLAGYLTVLNLGTSGRLWLNVPNSYVSQAQIGEGATLEMPGNGTLPFSGLDEAGLDYVEMGPAGWERMAAIITPQPLIESAVLRRSFPDEPLILLEKEDLQRISERLKAFHDNEWSAALLRFLVK